VSKTVATKPSRRDFLKYIGTAAAGVAVGTAARNYVWVPTPSSTVTITETATLTETETTTERIAYPNSLRSAAEMRGLLVGSEFDDRVFEDTRLGTSLVHEFNYLTGGEMGWAQVDSGYQEADALVKFASSYQMKVNGHTLIWHGSLPKGINENTSANTLRSAMQTHIRQEVGHFKGRIYAWNVVNEAVDTDGLRKTIFLEKLGEGYIAEAFQIANETDPHAMLFYNDYDAEAAGGLQKAKSDRVYELVKGLVNDGVPIHGVGLQMHLFAVEYPNPEDIAVNVRRLAALGLKVNISEMDVRIKELPLPMADRLELQRRIYHDVITACVREKGFVSVSFWGLTDAHSWINESGQGPDYPLLLDENYQPKPAYWGVMDALLGK
jgi:GH35 family endo-1,4-beta-xylanase